MHLFLVGEDGVLLLVAGDDHLDALFQVGLGHACLRPARTARRAASLTMLASSAPEAPEAIRATVLKSTSVGQRDLLGVDLQDLLAALEVGQLHRHPAVEAAGAGQGRVQRLRAVGGGQNDDAGVALKAVHLGQQLVQGLLPLVVAADTGRRCASGRWRRSHR